MLYDLTDVQFIEILSRSYGLPLLAANKIRWEYGFYCSCEEVAQRARQFPDVIQLGLAALHKLNEERHLDYAINKTPSPDIKSILSSFCPRGKLRKNKYYLLTKN